MLELSHEQRKRTEGSVELELANFARYKPHSLGEFPS